MRIKLFLLTGVACLVPLGLSAEDEGGKKKAPVVFATDPGEAHPRNVERDLIGEAAASADSGAFDYGTTQAGAATAAPTPLAAGPAPQAGEGLYGQDPIYRMARNAQGSAEATQVSYAQPAGNAGPQRITVQPGDTVFALSRRYGAKPAEIIKANDLPPPYALSIGQELVIPGLAAETPRQTASAEVEAPREEAPRAEKPVRARTVSTQPAPEQQAEATRPVRSEIPVHSQTQPLRQDVAYADETLGATYHTVEAGNTLYSISKSYGLDVDAVAAANNIDAPYQLAVGQQLLIPDTSSRASAEASVTASAEPERESEMAARAVSPVYRAAPAEEAAPRETRDASFTSLPESSPNSRFEWPLQGRVLMNYGMSDDGRRNDGINIAAPVGTPIRAVDDGEVVYRGAELEGYGNLLLIRHADGWVSAYAHTDSILVKKGDTIRKGQIIAKVGTSGSVDQPQLHFELRHDLKPTDPIAALDGRNQNAVR